MEQWNIIHNQDDIDNLMHEFGGFHDACLVSSSWNSGVYVDARNNMCFGGPEDCELRLLFHSQWHKKALELQFTGVRKHCMGGWQERYSNEIYDCYLKLHNELLPGQEKTLIVWADWDGFEFEKEQGRTILQEPMSSYVIAEKLGWRLWDKEVS